jgi:hypothetical protein
MVDKYTLKVGEPLNVKVKVEGKGHAGSLEHLNVAWPQDFELYEDKSNTQFVRTGHTERLFEYMLIPKTKGKFEIPAIELSMFDPDSRSYQIRKTQPIGIEVLEGSLGSVYVAKNAKPGAEPSHEDIRYWMSASPEVDNHILRGAARGVAMASMVLVVLSMWSLTGSTDESRSQARQRTSSALRGRAQALGKLDQSPVEVFGEIESLLGELLKFQYGILIGSLTRPELREALQAKSVEESTVRQIEGLLELCESQRYAPGAGDSASAGRAAQELSRLIESMSLV